MTAFKPNHQPNPELERKVAEFVAAFTKLTETIGKELGRSMNKFARAINGWQHNRP